MGALLSFNTVLSLGLSSHCPELPSSDMPKKVHTRTISQQTSIVSLQTRENPEGGSA